jgi:hypothetical protein
MKKDMDLAKRLRGGLAGVEPVLRPVRDPFNPDHKTYDRRMREEILDGQDNKCRNPQVLQND